MASSSKKEIYIVGYSLRLPNSDSPHELHQNLSEKINMVTQDDRRWAPGYNNTPLYFGKLKQSLDYFDNLFFGIPGKQAEKFDSQMRLLLETSFEALTDAAISPDELKGSTAGVYIGSSISDFYQLGYKEEHLHSGYELIGSIQSMYPNRLSYFYDLHGPSLNIDTACASSLSALHYAMNDLQQGKCHTAFVCSSSMILHPTTTTLFQKLQMLAPESFCKTFDKSANGFSRSEGVVTLLLTSHPEFIRYAPYAQLLASSTNSCGYQKEGIFFPNHQWQAALYKDILQQTDTLPSEINYIECHGTGTIAGDTEEVLGIKQVFGDRETLALGALKSNMGHAEGASGLAGIAKVLLSYETKTLYPQLHLQERNPVLGQLRTLVEPEPCEEIGKVVINSFGFGGVNVSALIAPVSFQSTLKKPWHGLYFLSSRTKAGLYELKRELEKSPQQLPSLQKPSYPWREVVGLPDALILEPMEKKPLYFIFSGNGSQWKGMGLELMQASSLFKDLLYQCGEDIPELLLQGWQGPLQDTRLLTAIQIALIELLKSFGLSADGYVAHSAGEIAASYASGAVTLEEAMALSKARGQAAEEMPDGLMVSVGLSREEALTYIEDSPKVCIACLNSPRNVTLSGDREQLERIVTRLLNEEKFVRILNTHGKPYHSLLLDRNGIKKHIKKAYPGSIQRNPTWFAAIENYNPAYFSADYHIESMMRPVDFIGAMSKLPADAIAVEIGPHAVLKSLVRDCTPSVRYVSLMERDKNDLDSFKEGIGQLWKLGANLAIEPDKVRLPLAIRMKQTVWERVCIPLPKNEVEQKKYKYVFAFDLVEKDAYLLGHAIGGKPIFPAMGAVYLLWQCYLKTYPHCTRVTLNHFKILRSVPLIGEQLILKVHITTNDTYQLLLGEELVAEATISSKEKAPIPPTLPDFSSEDHLSQKTFYRLCHNENYNYVDNFQVIKEVYVPNNGLTLYARLEFSKWISFLDGLLQLSLLDKPHSGLYLPTGIRCIELSENRSDIAVYNKRTRFIQCGEILIKGLEVTPIVRKKDQEQIVFQKEEYFFLGQNNVIPEKSAYADYLLTYALTKFQAAEHQFKEPHQQAIKTIIKKYKLVAHSSPTSRAKISTSHAKISTSHAMVSTSRGLSAGTMTLSTSLDLADKPRDVGILESHQHILYAEFPLHQLVDDLYSRLDELIASPLSCLTSSSYYPNVIYTDFTFELHYIEKLLSVVRQNTPHRKINLFEIGTATGGFITQVSEFLTPKDTIVCTDVGDNKFVHNEKTNALSIMYHPFDLNQAITPEIQTLVAKADIVVAANSFHLSHHLQYHLETLYKFMKPGAFMLLIEFTSPFALTFAGLSSAAWKFEDDREFGQWTSVNHWKALFQTVNFKLISYLTSPNEFITHFLIRKPFERQYEVINAPTLRYQDSWANQIKHPSAPYYIMHAAKNSGIAGFARAVSQEGKCVLSFCSSNPERHIQKVKACELITNVTINNKLATLCYTTQSASKIAASVKEYHLEIGEPGQFDTLKFVKNRQYEGQLCKVDYAALNFRDVMLASRKINKESFLGFSKQGTGLGMEFSGYCDKKRVMGIALDAIANYVNTPYFWEVPADITLAEAATIPVAYLTVYYSFFERAKITKQHRILIHGGAGAVGQAAIRVALDVGCEVFTTCHHDKRVALQTLFPQLDEAHIADSRSTEFEQNIMEQTQGKGVDIILNSLADDKLQASLCCLAQHGIFIEIGKYDLMQNTAIGLKHFLANTTLCGVDLDQIFSDAAIMESLSSRFMDGIKRKIVQPIAHTLFSWTQLSDAFRFLGSGKHIGKVLIDMRNALPPVIENRFYTTGSHLIVGGLGGIGMALAEWLAERGARHLILVTRKNTINAEQKLFIQRLKTKYPNLCLDITAADLIHARHAQEFIQACPPLTGIYNLAMVLNDGFFDGMTKEKWEKTLRCKVKITQHLDRHTRRHPIKQFVCFSSLAVQGNPGQSNYAFANNFMENICYARHRSKLPATAIQWGVIGNVGVVANKETPITEILQSVCQAQPITSCLEYLEICLLRANVVNVVYRQGSENKIEPMNSKDLISKINRILKIDLLTIPETTTLVELGIDSLQAAEIQAAISYFTEEVIPIADLGKITIAEFKEKFNQPVSSVMQSELPRLPAESISSSNKATAYIIKELYSQHDEGQTDEATIKELLLL